MRRATTGRAGLTQVERDREQQARKVTCPNPTCLAQPGDPCIWTWDASQPLPGWTGGYWPGRPVGAPMSSAHPSRYQAARQAGLLPPEPQ